MVARRRLNLSTGLLKPGGAERVVEPELDMQRRGPQEPAMASRFVELVRWLAPHARPTGSPMRSVAREIEELWPSRER